MNRTHFGKRFIILGNPKKLYYVKLYYIIIRTMRGIEIFQKPSYREIRPMRDRPMRGPPVNTFEKLR